MIRINMKSVTGMAVVLMMAVVARPAFAADLPTTLTDPYLRIQVSLAADKMDAVAESAKALNLEAQRLGAPAAKVAATAAKLGTAADIKMARTQFGDLSEALVAYAQTTGAAFGPNVNLVVCPMLQKPWLQKGTSVANPYYGKAMLTCGNIKKS